jgi:hypothetical protein
MARKPVLYPADRVPPTRGAPNIAAAIAHAKTTIRAAVPNGGTPKTYDDLMCAVRMTDDGYLLSSEQLVAAIDEVRDERPVESQKEYIDDPFELVAEKPKKV